MRSCLGETLLQRMFAGFGLHLACRKSGWRSTPGLVERKGWCGIGVCNPAFRGQSLAKMMPRDAGHQVYRSMKGANDGY